MKDAAPTCARRTAPGRVDRNRPADVFRLIPTARFTTYELPTRGALVRPSTSTRSGSLGAFGQVLVCGERGRMSRDCRLVRVSRCQGSKKNGHRGAAHRENLVRRSTAARLFRRRYRHVFPPWSSVPPLPHRGGVRLTESTDAVKVWVPLATADHGGHRAVAQAAVEKRKVQPAIHVVPDRSRIEGTGWCGRTAGPFPLLAKTHPR